MKQSMDPLVSLLPSEIIPHLEQMSISYLGYHFLRETLIQTLLGESEAPILFWMGKDIGKQIAITSPSDLTLLFIRLGLGKLEYLGEGDGQLVFTLRHSLFSHLSPDRLKKNLSLESGIITGAISHLKGRELEASLTFNENTVEKHLLREAQIVVFY